MNLQLSRLGITRLTGLAFICSVLGLAQAQVTTHTQLSSATSDHGVTFTANVSDSVGNAATDGIVTFENAQGASLGSAFVNDGEATLTGDAVSSLPDFSITANPTSLNLSPGQYGTVVLTITPINGFNNMVTLSCSSPPAASACIFSPTTATPQNGNPVTSSLQITTQGASGARLAWPGQGSSQGSSHSPYTAYAVVLPGLLALAGLGALRKRSGLNALGVLGLAALLAASTVGLSACSQRYSYLNHPPAPNPGIAAGSYTITVAAYSNNGAAVTSHTLNIALTVK